MKTLILLRHADAGVPAREDFERPLSGRGRQAADAIGRTMRRHGLCPDLVLCSPAGRTLATWQRIASCVGRDIPVRAPDWLYLADVADLFGAIRTVTADVNTLMLVGHNPGIGDLAGRLAMAGPAGVPWRTGSLYPTGGLTELRCAVSTWTGLREGRLIRFVRPPDPDAGGAGGL